MRLPPNLLTLTLGASFQCSLEDGDHEKKIPPIGWPPERMVTFHVLSMICGAYPQVILYMAGISPFIADDFPMTGSFYDLFRLG